jgi:hypothetical protein
MKVRCVVSPWPGHLDFGGFGFVRLAKKLCDMGHEVRWIVPPNQAARLKGGPWQVDVFPTLGLRLPPFHHPSDISLHPSQYRQLVGAVGDLEMRLRADRPHLVIVDRVMTLAAAVADHIGIPWVSIGTPAGWWRGTPAGTAPSVNPVIGYRLVGESVRKDLGWGDFAVDSVWANSPFLNISFLGKDFYSDTDTSSFPSAYVNHFEGERPSGPRQEFGVSFGNSGDFDPLVEVVRHLLEMGSENSRLEIYTGNRTEVLKRLALLRINKFTRLHGWVDFSLHFRGLGILFFLGGNGTLWECVNQFVPMCVIPSNLGDQRYNAGAIKRLGIGDSLDPKDISGNEIRRVVGSLGAHAGYQANIERFRAPHNFTDTIETVARRLEEIAFQ